MAKILAEKNTDGETDNIDSRKNKPRPQDNQYNYNTRLDAFASKKDLDPEDCPKGIVPMVCGKNTRVACLTGNIYNFAANKVTYVQKKDERTCAGKGAILQDANAIASRKQALADAHELAEFRAKKAAAEKAAAEKAAADKVAAEKAAADNKAAKNK